MPNRQQRLLADLVWPEEAYARSTNIELDNRDPEGVPDYKFTSKALRLLEDVLDSCQGSRRDRAWSVVGPYGSGKSTFSLFLLQLLTGVSSSWLKRCLVQLQLANPTLERRVHAEVASKAVRYLPVIVQGSRVPLDLALCQALSRAVSTDTSWTSESFRSSLNLTLQTLEAGIADSRRTVELYEQAAKLAKISDYQGLLVIMDEFGKFLERAAWQGDLPDLLAAQYLAELASSLKEPQVLFLVLVHQGFQHYASSLSQRQWLEWAKIQGRFRQVDFNEEPDNLYGLIATSLSRRGKSRDSKADVQRWARRVWGQVRNLPAFEAEAQTNFWPDFLPRVYPFHPLALYALPRLSSRLGQNERTLFTFLASDDPLGFKAFLRTTTRGNEELPSLTLDYLFDYFLSGARFASLPPDVQRRVAEIDAALDRLGDRPPVEVRLLKVLGALSVLRIGPSLRASEEVLRAALGVDNAENYTTVREALDRLLARKIIVFRKFSGEYRVWQGSDFDFEGALSKAGEDIQEDFDLTTVLNQELAPRPLLAGRHSFESGTTRTFAVRFMSAAEALHADNNEMTRRVDESQADGLAVHVLPGNRRELRELEEWVKGLVEPRLLVVIPKEPLGVVTLVQDLAALRRIYSEWPELQDDPVAMKELAARIETADELLREGIEAITEPASQGATWHWRGDAQPVTDRRQLNRLLSQVCDEVYPRAPRIRNELVNRRNLSSAVVVAVKKIIGGLLAAKGEPGLGFGGNGPEVSIFRAVFEGEGIYRETENGSSSLSRPTSETDRGLIAVWEEIEHFFHSSAEAGRPITQLYGVLTPPPYGVREGLIPLLIWAVLIYHRQTVCLYENGTYVREWAPEVFDRFVKAPETFTVRWLVLSGIAGRLLHKLNQSIPNAPELPQANGGVPLTGFLENLYRWYYNLPDYCKHTLKLSRGALEVRKVLTAAVDPIELVLSKLPQAMELPPVTSVKGLAKQRKASIQYINAFTEVVLEITSAYPVLCNEIITHMADTFGTRPVVSELRELFQGLGPEILDHVRDSTAKAFFLRAQQTQVSDVQWIESLGAVLANQAPRFWMDHHHEEFADKISLAGLALLDARRRAYARRDSSSGQTACVRHIIVEEPDRMLLDVFVTEGEMEGEPEKVAKAILTFLERSSPSSSLRHKQTILARALELTTTGYPEGELSSHEQR